MRYLCFVKMDESQAHPPQAIMDAMGAHIAEAAASGVFIDGGGLHGKAEALEFRVHDGTMSVTDGPYAEVKEVIGGWSLCEFATEEEARAEGVAMAEIHLKHWPGWEGAIEMRRISDMGPETA
jgi:hypothetical protein